VRAARCGEREGAGRAWGPPPRPCPCGQSDGRTWSTAHSGLACTGGVKDESHQQKHFSARMRRARTQRRKDSLDSDCGDEIAASSTRKRSQRCPEGIHMQLATSTGLGRVLLHWLASLLLLALPEQQANRAHMQQRLRSSTLQARLSMTLTLTLPPDRFIMAVASKPAPTEVAAAATPPAVLPALPPGGGAAAAAAAAAAAFLLAAAAAFFLRLACPLSSSSEPYNHDGGRMA
jgi:hypothetical protein